MRQVHEFKYLGGFGVGLAGFSIAGLSFPELGSQIHMVELDGLAWFGG